MSNFTSMAVRIASGTNADIILKASAKIAKNYRVYNLYYDDSGTLDVWLDVYALTYKSFYIVGAYVSDLCGYNGENADELRGHMYIRKFGETKNWKKSTGH